MRRGSDPVQEDLEDTAEALLGALPCRGVVGGWGSWEGVTGLRRGRGRGNLMWGKFLP